MTTVERTHEQPTRIPGLDIARAVLILLVVLYHSANGDDSGHAQWSTRLMSALGAMGVSGFFWVSGFSVHLNYNLKSKVTGCVSWSWFEFFKRRLSKLYPLYVCSLILSASVTVLWQMWRGRHVA